MIQLKKIVLRKVVINMEKKTHKHKLERIVKIRFEKSFKWGWFKFGKCLLGILIYSLGINLFIVPNHLYTGGILGMAQLLRTALVSIFKEHYLQ